MRPYDASTWNKVLKLKRDNKDTDDFWILVDGENVYIHEQRPLEDSVQRLSVDRKTFNKLISWYMRDQK